MLWPLCVLLIASSASSLLLDANHSLLHYEGRYSPQIVQEKTIINFDMPGFRISFKLKGAENVSMLLSSAGLESPNRFWVYINETKQENVIDTVDTEIDEVYSYVLSATISPHEEHLISIVKISEALFNSPNTLANYVSFHGLEVSSGELLPIPSSPRRKIEFIGDSLMAGFMNLCQEPYEGDFPDLYALESYAVAWPAVAAEMLTAEHHAIAWSGMGLVNDMWGGDLYIPDVFLRTLGSLAAESSNYWTFQRWVPELVFINVGTNDGLSAEKGTQEILYINTMVDLVMNMSKVYETIALGESSPTFPAFILACGPITSTYCAYLNDVKNILENLTTLDVNVFEQESGSSCGGHPNVEEHRALANTTAHYLFDVLDWKFDPFQPTIQPSSEPTWFEPSGVPSSLPTSQPSKQPSSQPTTVYQPSTQPSGQPSRDPSMQPSGEPTAQPSTQPSPFTILDNSPSSQPSGQPSRDPSMQPSGEPTALPSPFTISDNSPSTQPSGEPTSVSQEPSGQPSAEPSRLEPTGFPSVMPTGLPSVELIYMPSKEPSGAVPMLSPSASPSVQPSVESNVISSPSSSVPNAVESLARIRRIAEFAMIAVVVAGVAVCYHKHSTVLSTRNERTAVHNPMRSSMGAQHFTIDCDDDDDEYEI